MTAIDLSPSPALLAAIAILRKPLEKGIRQKVKLSQVFSLFITLETPRRLYVNGVGTGAYLHEDVVAAVQALDKMLRDSSGEGYVDLSLTIQRMQWFNLNQIIAVGPITSEQTPSEPFCPRGRFQLV